MKIVIAVDDSPHSERAVNFVRRVSWPAGSRVVVVTVFQPIVAPLTPVYEPSTFLADQIADLKRSHEDLLSRTGDALRMAGLATETRLLEGDPRDVLVEFVRTERADLLVVGSHGRTGLAKLMLGSVSSHAMTHAPCSVLVVKQDK
jgi:nucleotide-binding universal stress UspA family protein